MAADLQEAESSRRELTADIAHELRTPLTVLQANLSAMIDGVYDMGQEEVSALYDQVLRLNRLVACPRALPGALPSRRRGQRRRPDNRPASRAAGGAGGWIASRPGAGEPALQRSPAHACGRNHHRLRGGRR